MTTRYPTFFPDRVNLWHGDRGFTQVGHEAGDYISLGTPVTLDADGIIAAKTMDAAGNYTYGQFATAYTHSVMGRYGRNVSVVGLLTAGSANVFTVTGLDYLNQPVVETIAASGVTAGNGKKAFAKVTKIAWTASSAGATFNVGWGDVLGLPYKATALIDDLEDDLAPTAGTFVAAVTTDPATATTGDPRGTYAPNSATNGALEFKVRLKIDQDKVYGVQQYNV